MKAGRRPQDPRAAWDLEEALDRLNAETAAEAARFGGPRGAGFGLAGASRDFLKAYAREGAWRRGAQGLLYGLWKAYYTFILNLKIRERRRQGAFPTDRA